MITQLLKDAILQNIGPLKQAPKSWMKQNCRLCHSQGHGKDTRSRFGIRFDADNIQLNCFNCGFSASYIEGQELSKKFKFFLKQISIPDEFIKHIEFEIFKQKNKVSIVREGEVKLEDRVDTLLQKWKPIELPEGSLTLKEWMDNSVEDIDFMSVISYALSRGIFEIDRFYWTPNKNHELNQRLIIPYYYDNQIVGFTARLCYDTKEKFPPKYYQQCPTDFVYNLDNQQDQSRKYVVVTEGVLDAYVTDSVSVLGEIGQAKVDIINRLQKQVIVCPDRDKKGGDLEQVAIENGWAISLPKWGRDIKDAAKAAEKYGRLLTTYSIIEAATRRKLKTQLNWRIEGNERNRE